MLKTPIDWLMTSGSREVSSLTVEQRKAMEILIASVQYDVLSEASRAILEMATFADDNGKAIAQTVANRVLSLKRSI